MKKLVFIAATIVFLTACKSNPSSVETTTDSTSVDTVAVDSVTAIDTTILDTSISE